MLSVKQQNNELLSILVLVSLAIASNGQIPPKSTTNDGDFNNLHRDGSYEFGYNNNDEGSSYHISQANRNNVVRGRFGSRDPASKLIKETIYTAGPRGFRARGPNIHRKMDLDQRPRGPIGNKDDPYFDPNEDPSYSFGFKTPTYDKQEAANRLGDVTGRYSYIDDVGERHNVEYIAGKNTGFHVRTAYPDSSPGSIGPLYYSRPLVKAEKKPRGHTSIQRGTDGSYRFISAGPDQRRTESSDANGNVRGSYTFLDDKGVQRTVNYIAGPGIGYRVIKSNKEPFVPPFFPPLPDYRDPTLNKPFIPPSDDFINFPDNQDNGDDIFGRPGGSAASGHVKPPPTNNKRPSSQGNQFDDDNNKNDIFDNGGAGDSGFDDDNRRPGGGNRPERPRPDPTLDSDFGGQNQGRPTIIGDGDDDDIFGKPIDIDATGGDGPTGAGRPTPAVPQPGGSGIGGDDDDLFGPSFPDGATRPETSSRPTTDRPYSGRPGGRPTRPTGGRPGNRRPGTGRPGGARPTSPRPGYGDNRPSSRPGYGTTGPDFESRPDGETSGGGNGGYGRPESGSGTTGTDAGDVTEPGRRPTGRPGGNGRPSYNGRPGSNIRPGGIRPGSRPSSGGRPENRPDPKDPDFESGNKKPDGGSSFLGEDDDDVFGPQPPTNGDGYPGSTTVAGTGYGPTSTGNGGGYSPTATSTQRPDGGYKPTRPAGPSTSTGQSSGGDVGSTTTGGFLDESGEDQGGYTPNANRPISGAPGGATQVNISGHRDRHRYGTIFKNIGEESINFPPGASVRAHVQSIDLYPLKPKAQSPGEAIEEELKKHGSR